MRLDSYLSTNGIFESRNKASLAILNGEVTVNGIRISKPSYDVHPEDDIIIDRIRRYVARSAYKLLTAIDAFSVDFTDKVAVDLGASTGGFCEVMLDNAVKKVYAVDIGTAQLHERIRNNPHVVNMERTNARTVRADMFEDTIDIITGDLSFISSKLIIPAAYDTLKYGGEFICLVKPQFEVGAKNIGKNGVVRDKSLQAAAVSNVIEFARQIGFSIIDIAYSGLDGEAGNKEYLVYMKKYDCDRSADCDIILNKVFRGIDEKHRNNC